MVSVQCGGVYVRPKPALFVLFWFVCVRGAASTGLNVTLGTGFELGVFFVFFTKGFSRILLQVPRLLGNNKFSRSTFELQNVFDK